MHGISRSEVNPQLTMSLVFATPWAGRKITQHQENKTALISMPLLVLAWGPLIFAQRSLFLYAFGAILAYLGILALHVLNQNLVYRISAPARLRINSIYMTLCFSSDEKCRCH